MITKQRLSVNNSLGDVSTPISGCESSSGEISKEVMNSEEQCQLDRRSNERSTQRREGSSHKKRLPGLFASDDSCNAVDNMLGINEKPSQSGTNDSDGNADLSFNGKIKPLTRKSPATVGSMMQTAAAAADAVEGSTKNGDVIGVERNGDTSTRTREEKLNESFELLTKENNSFNHYNNEKSPDLFADDDDDVDDAEEEDEYAREGNGRERENDEYSHRTYGRASGTSIKELDTANESSVDRSDRMLLKRMQMSLSGIPPPPALTYSDIDVGTMLTIYRNNVEPWLATHGVPNGTSSTASATNSHKTDEAGDGEVDGKQTHSCLLKPTHSIQELASLKWPELTKHRVHGLHYNRSGTTEMFELLGLKYVERYIGAETCCSFNMAILQSSAKKRNQRLKMLNQSPGRRLSHLARRRATFSSENLLNNSGSKGGSIVSAGKGAIDAGVLRRLNPHRVCNNRQVLLDPKKSDNRRKNTIKTPQRRTPGGRKSPRRRTPGSSAKKLSLLRTNASGKPSTSQLHVPATRESSKRALFLSPQNGGPSSAAAPRNEPGSSSKQTDRSIFSEARILKSKRSLFSPTHGPSADDDVRSSSTVSNKRRRSPTMDSEENEPKTERTEKIRRTEATGLTEDDLTPRSLKYARSRSFCVGAQSKTGHLPSVATTNEASIVGGKPLVRARSDMCPAQDGPRPVAVLTEHHKNKLLWAVSKALQSKQITQKHEMFKQYASTLTRVVKKLYLEFFEQTSSSTSEKLIKLANKHVYEVIQGKTELDIYLREKTRIMNARNVQKLQGYIAPDEYELRKLRRATSTTSFDGSSLSLFDCSLSASQSFLSQSSSILSQGSSFGGGLSQPHTGLIRTGSGPVGAHIKAAASTGSVNTVGLGGTHGGALSTTALRENVDSELRQRSTKKQLIFSGKDQKNVSPYRMGEKGLHHIVGGGVNGNKLLVGGGALNSSIMKAKRQISFE